MQIICESLLKWRTFLLFVRKKLSKFDNYHLFGYRNVYALPKIKLFPKKTF